jgi:hypothetical protein
MSLQGCNFDEKFFQELSIPEAGRAAFSFAHVYKQQRNADRQE